MAAATAMHCESHFLPSEEGGLDDVVWVAQRAMMAAQELAEDAFDARQLHLEFRGNSLREGDFDG